MKKYKINGKEINVGDSLDYISYTETEKYILKQLLETLSDKEECKHRFSTPRAFPSQYEGQGEICLACVDCGKKIIQEPKLEECKHKNTGNCLACYGEEIEPKQEKCINCGTIQIPNKSGCTCYVNYGSQSTSLKEEIENILYNGKLSGELILTQTDQIISLVKDHIERRTDGGEFLTDVLKNL